jgi:phenylpyruvate tautomerase PptA (4-oxalocrotonate tautomerase family)
MPIVRIDIQSGKTTEYKRALLHGVRDALVNEIGVAPERIMQRVVETPREDIDATDPRSDRLTIIEVTMLPRARELKEALYRGVASRLGVAPGISSHDLVVLVNDADGECLFLNGRMQCEGAEPFVPEPAEAPPAPAEPEPADGAEGRAVPDAPAAEPEAAPATEETEQ